MTSLHEALGFVVINRVHLSREEKLNLFHMCDEWSIESDDNPNCNICRWKKECPLMSGDREKFIEIRRNRIEDNKAIDDLSKKADR